LLEKIVFSNNAFILMYHRVLESAIAEPYYVQPGMYVNFSTFDKHLAFLAGKFKVVSLQDLLRKLKEGENISRHCTITFDDGWRDNYTQAFPLLKKYQLPATIFLTTGFVGTDQVFWPEEICYLFQVLASRGGGLKEMPASVKDFFSGFDVNQADLPRFFEDKIQDLKILSPERRGQILCCLRNEAGPQYLHRQMINWNEAKEMLESGLIQFGAHTVNHEILDQISLEQAAHEIGDSVKDITWHLQVTPRFFAYPNGNYNNAVQKLLNEHEVQAGLTTKRGYVNNSSMLFELPRIAVHDDVSSSIPMLRSRLLFRRL